MKTRSSDEKAVRLSVCLSVRLLQSFFVWKMSAALL